MAVTFNRGDGIVVLTAALDTIAFDPPALVDQIMLRSTTAGAFVVKLGNASITINNSANALTVPVPVGRYLKSVTLTSGPAGLVLTVFLRKARK